MRPSAVASDLQRPRDDFGLMDDGEGGAGSAGIAQAADVCKTVLESEK